MLVFIYNVAVKIVADICEEMRVQTCAVENRLRQIFFKDLVGN